MKCGLSLLVLLSVSAWTESGVVKKVSSDDNDEDDGDLKVAQKLEKNNNNNPDQNSAEVTGGVAVPHLRTPRNTKPCVLRDCMWPKAADGKVYIPYAIAKHYTSQELDVIKRGLNSFSYSTCIRFFPRTNQTDFLYIQSLDGCYSYVGRRGNLQTVSLSRQGCVHYGMVQHELLHALGFNHEHCRSDRDQHIRVQLQNVIKGQEFNFRKVSTLNQETPYDYGSVMHYGRLAFSKDSHSPTMEAVPDPNIKFGLARQMSQSDIDRINLLYCTN
uniref:high choriolytic enzyme 1-like n=1 Tax=Scatophagus argus TaxID=75038 RepID=UPI001ED84AC0|nr:high choriolytic enzyme 1-like [Scatophagus argus]